MCVCMFPLWRPFSKVCGYRMRFCRIRVDAKRNRTVSLCLIITNMLQTYNGFMTNSVHVARAHMEVITQLQEGMIFMFEWLPRAFSSNFHLISSLFPIFAVDENPSLVATWRKCSECDTCCVMFPLWRPFSKVCGYRMRFRRIRVDAKRNRNKMFADTNESGYVWTGPYNVRSCYCLCGANKFCFCHFSTVSSVSLCLIITNMLQTYNGFMTNSVHVARAHMEVITQLQEGMIFMFEWLPRAFSSNFHLISSLFPIFAIDENPSLVATWRKCSECDTCCVFPNLICISAKYIVTTLNQSHRGSNIVTLFMKIESSPTII